MNFYVGLDIVTNGARVVIVDERLNLHYENNASYSISSPQEGWAEQNPDEIYNTCRELLKDIMAAGPKRALQKYRKVCFNKRICIISVNRSMAGRLCNSLNQYKVDPEFLDYLSQKYNRFIQSYHKVSDVIKNKGSC